jgi:hypothetical protein
MFIILLKHNIMKKNLVLSLFMLTGLAACQKESSNVKTSTASNLNASIMKPAVGTQPSVAAMTLVAPNTYQALWHGIGVQLMYPAYDRVKYPTVVDGIPVYAETMSVYGSVAAVVNGVSTSGAGNVFSVWVPILGGLPSPSFQSDADSYMQLWNNWFAAGSAGAEPQLASNVQTSYSGEGGSITYTGKVIEVTTGSGLALADVTYPLPAASTTPPAINDLVQGFVITDPNNSSLSYYILGTKGIVTTAQPIAHNGGANLVANGTYTIPAGITTAQGTVIRADGSTFTFDSTQDTR